MANRASRPRSTSGSPLEPAPDDRLAGDFHENGMHTGGLAGLHRTHAPDTRKGLGQARRCRASAVPARMATGGHSAKAAAESGDLAAARAAPERKGSNRMDSRRGPNDRIKHLFLWPAFLVVLAISLFPLIYALTVSFQSMRLVPPLPPRFVGLDNYANIVSSARFWGSVGVTSTIVFISVAIQYVAGFALALALHHNVPGSSLYRVTFLLPMFLAPVCVAMIARMIFHPSFGPVNQFFSMLGLPNLPFLTEPNFAIAVLIAIEVWQWTPFVLLLMLAGLQSLPPDVFEAARVDNVPAWRRFRDITFPMLLPISVAVVFIRIVEGFKVIDTVFALTGGGPGTSTETLTLYAYNEGFKKFNLGQASALSFVFLFVVIVFGTVYLAAAQRAIRKHA